MSKSVTDLRSIAAAGAGMILDAGGYSTTDLRSIAAAASSQQAQLKLLNVSSRSTTDLRSIAAAGKGCVIFDFS